MCGCSRVPTTACRPGDASAIAWVSCSTQGYRLACQTYVSGDVSVAWDPDQKEMEASGRAYDRLRQVWLSKADDA